MKRFVKINKKETFTAELQSQAVEAKSIVFIVDTCEIFTQGTFYGLSAEYKTKIDNLVKAVDALELFKETLGDIVTHNVSEFAKSEDFDELEGKVETLETNHIKEIIGDNYISVSANGANAKKVSFDVTKLVDTNDKFLKTENGNVVIDIDINYDSTTHMIQLRGINNVVVAEFSASDFIKDGMISKEGTSFNPDTKILTLAFNTDAGIEPITLDLTSLIDTYTGSNVKLVTVTLPETYSAPAAGDSVDTAIAKLAKGVADVRVSGVTSLGGVTGDLTLKGDETSNGKINLTINEKRISAEIIGLKSAAFTESSEYATKGQGDKADSALQEVEHGTDGDYVTTTVSAKASNKQSVSVEVKVQEMKTASESNKGLVEASDLVAYLEENFRWEEH